jgi:hypothetical protein
MIGEIIREVYGDN